MSGPNRLRRVCDRLGLRVPNQFAWYHLDLGTRSLEWDQLGGPRRLRGFDLYRVDDMGRLPERRTHHGIRFEVRRRDFAQEFRSLAAALEFVADRLEGEQLAA